MLGDDMITLRRRGIICSEAYTHKRSTTSEEFERSGLPLRRELLGRKQVGVNMFDRIAFLRVVSE